MKRALLYAPCWEWRRLLMGASLAALLVPGQLTLIPTHALMVQLGWGTP